MSQCKRGITLVELLTVIVILSVLMAILLPAYNLMREAGRRTQCQNNQAQLTLAVTGYETANNRLPGYLSTHLASNGTPYYYNWVGALMPYIEHNDIWQQITTGGKPMETVKIVVCPDDGYLKNNPMASPLSYVVNNQYLYQATTPPVYSGFLNYQPFFAASSSPPTNFAGKVVPPTIISKMVSPSTTVMMVENVGSMTTHLPGPWNTQITIAAPITSLTFYGPVSNPANYTPYPPVVSAVIPNSPHGSVVIMSFFDGHQQSVNTDAYFPAP